MEQSKNEQATITETATAVLESPPLEVPTPAENTQVPVVKSEDAQQIAEALVNPRLATDFAKYVDPSDVKDPSGRWVYGMIDFFHRDHVGMGDWQPLTWDDVRKEGLKIPFNPIIRSSAEQKGDNYVRQGTLVYARMPREVAEEIKRKNSERSLLKIKSVAPKKLAKELNEQLSRRGLAKDYRMVVVGEDTILIGKR
jgi:hypothetical protein